MDGVEAGERLVELVAGDLVVVDVELEEDRLVEQAALFVVAAAVELLGAGQQGRVSPRVWSRSRYSSVLISPRAYRSSRTCRARLRPGA